MLSKDKGDEIIRSISTALQGEAVGMIILRADDGSLVLYLNDKESAIRESHKFQNPDKDFKGGN